MGRGRAQFLLLSCPPPPLPADCSEVNPRGRSEGRGRRPQHATPTRGACPSSAPLLLKFSPWGPPQLLLLSSSYPGRPLSRTRPLLKDPKPFHAMGSTPGADSVLWPSQATRAEREPSLPLPAPAAPPASARRQQSPSLAVCGGGGGAHSTGFWLRNPLSTHSAISYLPFYRQRLVCFLVNSHTTLSRSRCQIWVAFHLVF